MKTLFKLLLRVRFMHTYYRDKRSKQDFSVRPSAECDRLIHGYGLVLQHESDGFSIHAEVKTNGSNNELIRSVGGDTLRFVFLLQCLNPGILNVSDLPQHRPGREVFYFSNLRDDRSGGRSYLGDHVVDARVGTPIRLVYGSIYNFRFSSPVNQAAFVLQDLFGKEIYHHSFRIPDPSETVEEYRLDLNKIDKLQTGRYEITDNNGKTESFYYIPGQFGKKVFSIIEIYNKTDTLTLNNDDLVPLEYKFLNGDILTDTNTFTIQINRRKTTWQYIVNKKYTSNTITLEGLKISGNVDFNKSLPDGKAVFRSTAEVPLKEKPKNITLEHDDKSIRKLPSPSLNTPLKEGAGPSSFESHMYIYV